MPNWISNKISMKRIAFHNIFNEERELDFNKIVPQPKTIEECPKKFLLSENGTGTVGIEILKDRPWFNWYDWCWDNWGTKWGAHDTHVVDENTICFKTAWCPPIKVIEALSQKNPSKIVKLCFVNEDYDGEHYLLYKNGKRIAVKNVVDEHYWDYLYEE